MKNILSNSATSKSFFNYLKIALIVALVLLIVWFVKRNSENYDITFFHIMLIGLMINFFISCVFAILFIIFLTSPEHIQRYNSDNWFVKAVRKSKMYAFIPFLVVIILYFYTNLEYIWSIDSS